MTGFNLTEFMSNSRDFARAYLFEADIKKFGKDGHGMYVKSTKLPEHTIGEIETDFQGNKYKIASTSEVQDFSISFNSDVEDQLRNKFVTWMLEIHNPATNLHGTPGNMGSGYFSDIILKHLNGQGNAIMIYGLHGAWPKSIGELTLDYSTKEIATFDVTFSYQYHLAMQSNASNAAQVVSQVLSDGSTTSLNNSSNNLFSDNTNINTLINNNVA